MTPRIRDIRTAGLSPRQRTVLRLVVKRFVETAGPVGSKALVEEFNLGLSPASVRSTLAQLEKAGFLAHPHTSAGRVPTELGYRAFVDELMDAAVLPDEERTLMERQIMRLMNDTDELIRESSRLLARLARLLGVVLSPRLTTGVLERLDVVPVASDRIMFVLSIRGGLVRTIMFQVPVEIRRSQLERLVVLLNERLAGLTLEEIRRTCVPRIQDLSDEDTGIVRLILDRSGDLFSDRASTRSLELDGTPFMLSQPEFSDSPAVRQLIELIDDEPGMVELLEGTPTEPGRAQVRIGHRPEGQVEGCRLSIVTASYLRSNMQGRIGVIGPTRMNYGRAVALVEGMAMLMSRPDMPDA